MTLGSLLLSTGPEFAQCVQENQLLFYVDRSQSLHRRV